jgi:hypothetical protein
MQTGIETAMPFPRILAMRVAAAIRDRADMDIAVIDVPDVLPFGIAAAGELGVPCTPLKRGLALQLLCWEMSESMGNHDSKIVDAGSVD